ncbi:putative invertase inhibitor [Beta vulgaris subsp. vulgaris]|uniref:putative invertase inhibitor n=1 Tax=Beta vulgaris subsp. vulgaris TaxID=3555 RepID=UPI0025467562|nr:putative invertase inhibitor [Beta vulgaris subsp. vulgaris]
MENMASPYTFLFSLLLLFGASGASNLINQTCKNSSKNDPNINNKFCVYALQSAPASHCANITRLGLISITLIKHNVTDIRCLIKQLLQDKKVDLDTKQALQDCLELYSDSLVTLTEAAIDYRENRFVDANVKVSSVMEASSTCEEEFHDVGSPLTVQNNRIFQLSAISLSIMNKFLSHDR